MDWIVHMCTQPAWQAAQARGQYEAASLETEGFIHFSRPEQAPGSANRHFRGARDLLVLWVNPQRLHAELRWELSDGQIFPHLYGPLNLDAVRKVNQYQAGPDGVFRQLPGPPAEQES